MPNIENPTELNLLELFTTGHYIVPVYQRNYAWAEEQIEQLILDIWDYAERNKETGYYIGSLVVFQRESEETFEVLDGQQRHTTLSILLAVLKNEFGLSLPSITRINLTYDSRKRAHRTLQALLANQELLDYEQSIKNAYEICQKYLMSLVGKDKVSVFADYLVSKVKVLRVLVPQDTDKNHYFEIMNNRGEQLEKHEVLKARLMNSLNSSRADMNTFATIWDACSDMRRYVQYGFDKSSRHRVFGTDLNSIPNSFDQISNAFLGKSTSDTQKKILESLTTAEVIQNQSKERDDAASERFTSVINFSNFLLHTLRIYKAQVIRSDATFDIALDDKALLKTFEEQAENIDAKEFVVLLLRLRFLFDKYIIKREWDDKWSLKQLRWYENQDNINYVNTFDNEAKSTQSIMLISMLHVSFPSLIYKHWLNGVLLFLHEQDHGKPLEADEYVQFLESYNTRLFFGRFSTQPREYRDLIYTDCSIDYNLDTNYLNQATNTQNYIFNRLDYLLWKINTLEQGTAPEVFKLNPSIINKFSFSFRSSVEHYYPQHPIGGEPLPNCDRFGNLCLISRSNNSKLSNYLPNNKKEHYVKSTAIESLKQQIMMKYPQWGPESTSAIEEHETAMIALLSKRDSEIIKGATYA